MVPRFLASRLLVLSSVGLLLLAVRPAEADETATIAKNLAENILGKGLVRSTRVTDNGRTVAMVWESATFKPANTLAHTRELLRVEVHLTSGAIFRVLRGVQEFQFEILLQKRAICSGSVGRSRPMQIAFAPGLRE
jgi:hypothetical protein